MSNQQLKQALEQGLDVDKPASEEIELTDGDLEDVAGGACASYCGSFSNSSVGGNA